MFTLMMGNDNILSLTVHSLCLFLSIGCKIVQWGRCLVDTRSVSDHFSPVSKWSLSHKHISEVDITIKNALSASLNKYII